MSKLSLQLFSLSVSALIIIGIAFAINPSTRLEVFLVALVGIIAYRPLVRSCYKFHNEL